MSQPPATNTPPSAPHAIEGTWSAVRLEYAGEAAPDMLVEKTEIVFRNGKYSVRFGGESTFRGSYKITECTLHITGRHAPKDPALDVRGIYQLVGNRLRLCLGMDGIAPEIFASKIGSQHYLGTYRRVS